MFDDDDERDGLLIDDENDQLTDPEKSKLSPPRVNFTSSNFQENGSIFHDTNGISTMTGLNSSREEGELEDDEMETSPSPKKTTDIKTATANTDRKRVNGDSDHISSSDSAKKKAKIEKKDESTCVRTEASQADVEESIFDVEAGSSFPLQLTVVCQLEGTETLYFTAKWKDREYSGLLTDGDPPGFANFAKKRSALNNNNGSESEKASISTPKKRKSTVNDTKKKNSKAEDDEEDLDVTGLGDTRDSNSSGGSIKLIEVNSTSLHYCSFDGCRHAYGSSAEMEYHIGTIHKKKSVIYEHNSTQTQTEGVIRKMNTVSTDTEGLLREVKVEKEDLKDEQPGSHFSDISDDAAPVLCKEEPRGVESVANPSTSSISTSKTPQAAVVQPTHVVPPITASPRSNGLLMPSATFVSPFSAPASTSIVTPVRDTKPAEAPKPVASPAQSRQPTFHPGMPIVSGAGPSQTLHHPSQLQAAQMMQMQLIQQMQMLQQGRPPLGMQMPQSAQELAAFQALAQGGFNMFSKH